MKIRTVSEYWTQKYGGKVYKLSLQSGCTCPNRDGTISIGGCTFCSEGGSGDFAASYRNIVEQIAEAKRWVDRKFPQKTEKKYMAYFQSFTNTHGDVKVLEDLYRQTLSYDEIVGLSIGTRPDCLGDDILKMLERLNEIKPVTVELGLQTIHEETAKRINRGYPLAVFEKAYRDLTDRKIEVVVHVILGLPGETEKDMLETVEYLSKLTPVLPGIKLQLLHVLRGTKMGEEYLQNPFPVFIMEEYTDLVVKCLKLLPKETVVHRMTGDGPKKILIEPLWSGDKKRVLNMLQKKIESA